MKCNNNRFGCGNEATVFFLYNDDGLEERLGISGHSMIIASCSAHSLIGMKTFGKQFLKKSI
jgi:hypothetical protein